MTEKNEAEERETGKKNPQPGKTESLKQRK